MPKSALIFCLLLAHLSLHAQVQVEYDKNRDLTPYKTFRFGEGEIITPKDQRVYADTTVHRIIRDAIRKELLDKGLQEVDTAAVTVTYIAGMQQLSSAGTVGPLGISPTNPNQNYMRDYQQGTLVIDLNDARSNYLIWRIRVSNSTGAAMESLIERSVAQGFKKFSIAPKKKKGKKKS